MLEETLLIITYRAIPTCHKVPHLRRPSLMYYLLKTRQLSEVVCESYAIGYQLVGIRKPLRCSCILLAFLRLSGSTVSGSN